MASIHQDPRKKSPFWYVAYTDENGKRHFESTHQTAESKARQVADRMQVAIDKAREGTLTEEWARDWISELVKRVHGGGDGLRTFTARKWFDHFCKLKGDSQNPKTAAKYKQVAREFLEFLGNRADKNILSVSSADVRAWRDHRKQKGLSATTLNDDITILSAIFNGAWRDHVISNNPCTAVEPVKDIITPAKRRKQPFTVEQVSDLLDQTDGDWHGLIKVAFFTAARLENCANLRLRNLDFSTDPPVVVFEKYSKHGDEHTVPMHPALKDCLLSIKKKRGQLRKAGKIIELPKAKSDDEFLFPSLAGRRVANLSKQFRKIMVAAHIENWKVREGVKGTGKSAARDVWALGFHSFRRTHVSILANAGVSEEQRIAITANATREIHKGYTHHQLSPLHKAVSALPSV